MLCQTLTSMLEGSFDAALLVDAATGKVAYLNSTGRSLFGLSDDDEVSKMEPSDFFSFPDVANAPFKTYASTNAAASGGSSPQPWDLVLASVGKKGKKRVQRDITGVHKDGSDFPASISIVKLDACWCRCCSDVADQKMPPQNGTPDAVTESHYFGVYVREKTVDHRVEELEMEVRRLNRTRSALVTASKDSTIIVDEGGIIQSVSEATLKQFGYELDELVGENVRVLMTSDHSRNHDAYMRFYFKTGIQRVIGQRREFKAKRKDGSLIPIELGVAEIETEPGERRMFAGMICNISSKNEAHEMLLKSERIRRGVMDASFDAIFTINETGKILMVNDAAVKQFGWRHGEFIGKNINMICGKYHYLRHDKYLRRYLRTGEKRLMGKKRELPARRKDGSEFIIELGLSEITTHAGDERMFCGFVRDLTRQKKDKMELLRKECLTTGIIQAAFDPMFCINETGEIQMVNEAAVKQFGWSREEFIGSNIDMICGGGHGAKHDLYLKRYLTTGEKRVMGIRRELSARRKDGSEFTIELGIAEIRTLGDDDRTFCGFVRDLTRQKEDHKELEIKRNFMKGVIEASFDALFVTDENGAILMVNEASCKQFGWEREEMMGQNIKMAIGPKHAGNHDKYIKAYLKTGIKKVMNTQRELEARRKDGSTFPILLGLAEVEADGNTRRFAAFIRDLSDQKKMIEMEVEKARSEGLLHNMLPKGVAMRLREDPSHLADHYHYDNATILFAHIDGFTSISSQIDPAEGVNILNDLFSMFDDLVDEYGLNKAKTMGECYMVTSVPEGSDHGTNDCARACHFALDMIDALQRYTFNNPNYDLKLRVGINVGPVVAGMIGKKRFCYDFWGKAVILASKMEKCGIPGKIQVTKDVADIMKEEFSFESRGMLDMNGEFSMETFFLVERRIVNKSIPRKRRSHLP